MKDFRKHIGRLQFISRVGFDKHNFGVGITATYLPGMDTEIDQERFLIEGFWNFEIELLFIVLTLNVTDKPCVKTTNATTELLME